jgi:hypothetical protein
LWKLSTLVLQWVIARVLIDVGSGDARRRRAESRIPDLVGVLPETVKAAPECTR